MELHAEEVAGSRHDPGSFLDLSQRLHLSHYRRSEMTNYSNDLDLSRLLLGDLMFCINDNALRTGRVLICNVVVIALVCEEKCRIVS